MQDRHLCSKKGEVTLALERQTKNQEDEEESCSSHHSAQRWKFRIYALTERSTRFETDISDVVSHRPLSNAFIYDRFSYFREPLSQSFVNTTLRRFSYRASLWAWSARVHRVQFLGPAAKYTAVYDPQKTRKRLNA